MANDLATLTTKLATALRDSSNVTWASTELNDLLTWAAASLYPRLARPMSVEFATVSDQEIYALPWGVREISRIDLLESDGDLLMALPGGSWEIMGDPEGDIDLITLTGTSASADDIIDVTGHGLTNGQPFQFATITGGTGLSVDTTYYVVSATQNGFQAATTKGGTAINFTSDITAGTIRPLPQLFINQAWADGTRRYRIVGYGAVDLSTHLPSDRMVPLILATARAEAGRREITRRFQSKQWGTLDQQANVTVNELTLMVNESDAEAERLRRSLFTWRRPKPARV